MKFRPFIPLNYKLSSKRKNDLGLTVKSGPQWQAQYCLDPWAPKPSFSHSALTLVYQPVKCWHSMNAMKFCHNRHFSSPAAVCPGSQPGAVQTRTNRSPNSWCSHRKVCKRPPQRSSAASPGPTHEVHPTNLSHSLSAQVTADHFSCGSGIAHGENKCWSECIDLRWDSEKLLTQFSLEMFYHWNGGFFQSTASKHSRLDHSCL